MTSNRMQARVGGWSAAVTVLALIAAPAAAAEVQADSKAGVKNVILMVGDGAGYNCWIAASMYQGRWDAAQRQSRQVYDGPGWVRLGCSTHPLNVAKLPTKAGVQDPRVVYDPARAWGGKAAYTWLMEEYTDSAAAATALATGQKTYNHALNWSDTDQPLGPTLAELARAQGRAVGVVTSVQWSHATPAGLGGVHVRERDQYAAIAQQMLTSGVLDVIMGAGHPDFDDNGQPKKTKREFKYVGGEATWKALEAARAQPDGRYHGFRPVSAKAEFEALVRGPTPPRVVGTAQVAQTLQKARRGGKPGSPAYDEPLLATVPSLTTMTAAALNVLDENPQGMFLMIEGGAIDWANHDHQPGRMIEEQLAFLETIEAVVAWIEAHGNWEETLLVLTADHETGLLWGPDSDTQFFAPLADRGPRNLPGLKYHSKNHTNSLVPLFAKGAGSDWFASHPAGVDPVRGTYVDNSTVFAALRAALKETVPK